MSENPQPVSSANTYTPCLNVSPKTILRCTLLNFCRHKNVLQDEAANKYSHYQLLNKTNHGQEVFGHNKCSFGTWGDALTRIHRVDQFFATISTFCRRVQQDNGTESDEFVILVTAWVTNSGGELIYFKKNDSEEEYQPISVEIQLRWSRENVPMEQLNSWDHAMTLFNNVMAVIFDRMGEHRGNDVIKFVFNWEEEQTEPPVDNGVAQCLNSVYGCITVEWSNGKFSGQPTGKA